MSYPFRVICFGPPVASLALRYRWWRGARYTELRHIRRARRIGLIDIPWKRYDFDYHLRAVRRYRPRMTVLRDIERGVRIDSILRQAEQLGKHAGVLIAVPKRRGAIEQLERVGLPNLILGYSVPTRHGGTQLPTSAFSGWPVHLLGGHPRVQRKLAEKLDVVSLDCNRLSIDAAFGDTFDGHTFRPGINEGYVACAAGSMRAINRTWRDYDGHIAHRRWLRKWLPLS
ncbi:MAG: DUF6610 family protein [Myxococcota bacterium]